MKKRILFAISVFGLATAVSAEFGVGVGASFNTKVSFESDPISLPRASNPGGTGARENHEYDDGYVRVDSTGNRFNETTYWGYQNASQYDSAAGTINMHSSQTSVNASRFSEDDNAASPAVEVYWSKDLKESERWGVGVRVALRWQRIEMDQKSLVGTTREMTTDSYSLNGSLPPGAPFNGTANGAGYASIGDTPTRTFSSTAGAAVLSRRSIDANVFALDFGPNIWFDITDKIRANLSAGGTIAWVRSEFDYQDGATTGSDRKSDVLLGLYLGGDIQYLLGENWGLLMGAAYTRFEDFEHDVDGRKATLQFDDSYTVRTGLFFR